MKVTLTGAAGHLGARACASLAAAGHAVRATDKVYRAAVLAADLPGFRTFFPAARGSLFGKPLPDVIREFYPTVPLRRPVEELEGLMDLTKLTDATGWSPAIPVNYV